MERTIRCEKKKNQTKRKKITMLLNFLLSEMLCKLMPDSTKYTWDMSVLVSPHETRHFWHCTHQRRGLLDVKMTQNISQMRNTNQLIHKKPHHETYQVFNQWNAGQTDARPHKIHLNMTSDAPKMRNENQLTKKPRDLIQINAPLHKIDLRQKCVGFSSWKSSFFWHYLSFIALVLEPEWLQ